HLEGSCCLVDAVDSVLDESQGTHTGHALDTADTSSHRGFADDLKQAQTGSVAHMGTAAELAGEAVFHTDNANDIAVFLSEQSHSAQLLGLSDGHLFHLYRHSLEDFLVDLGFHLGQLLGGEGGEVSEVKAHVLAVDQLTS